MLYCTRENIVNRLGGENRLPAIGNRAGAGIDEARVNQAISDASATIDMYIDDYATLKSSWQTAITTIATSIAVYILMNSVADKNVDTKLYNTYIEQLKLIGQKSKTGVNSVGTQSTVIEPNANEYNKNNNIAL